MTREINQAGIELIKRNESLQMTAYVCPAGKLSIGYGHVGADVTPGMVITKEKAEQLLKRDLLISELGTTKSVTVPLTDNQFSALVSFAFNIGLGNFRKSTLLKKLNAGQYDAVPAELRKWVRGGGKVLAGLVRRRAEECQLWRQA